MISQLYSVVTTIIMKLNTAIDQACSMTFWRFFNDADQTIVMWFHHNSEMAEND